MVISSGAQPSTRNIKTDIASFSEIEQQARDTMIQERESRIHHWVGGTTSKPAPSLAPNQTTLHISNPPQRKVMEASISFFGPKTTYSQESQPPEARTLGEASGSLYRSCDSYPVMDLLPPPEVHRVTDTHLQFSGRAGGSSTLAGRPSEDSGSSPIGTGRELFSRLRSQERPDRVLRNQRSRNRFNR